MAIMLFRAGYNRKTTIISYRYYQPYLVSVPGALSPDHHEMKGLSSPDEIP